MADDKLGKYEIRGQLGRGAMGTVYDGWDPIIARRVAIKTVRLPDSSDAEAQDELARFRREAQAAGRLTHPNIVGVFDYGETETLAFIVMEFVDGRTLKSITDKDERLPLAEIARIMNDMLAGLQFSHDRGVVHRDIKPANVMLTQQGQAKIADFGIARIESSSMTQAGTVLGTPAYMSPEQFMGQIVDLRTDIYSAGVLLYQLLTGERPFDGSMTAIMHKALNTVPPKPSELSVTCPQSFDAVVARAMAKRPEERFGSAKALADAITGAVTATGTTVPASAAAATSLPPASLDDLLDTDATMVAPRRPAAPPPAGAAPPVTAPTGNRARGGSGALIAIAAVAVLAVLGGGGYLLFGGSPAATPTNLASVAPPPPSPPPTSATSSPASAIAVNPPITPPASATSSPGPAAAAPSLAAPVQAPAARPAAGGAAVSTAAPSAAPQGATAAPPTNAPPSAAAPSAPAARPPPSTAASTPPAPAAGPPATVAAVPATSLPGPRPASPANPGTAAMPVPATPPPASVQAAAPPPGPTQFAGIVPVPGPPPAVAPPPPSAAMPMPVAPALSPPAPTAVEPARLSPAALRQATAAVAAAAQCALVSAEASDSGGAVSVSGIAGKGVVAGLRQAFELAAPGVELAWQVTEFDGPYCKGIDAIRAVAGRGNGLVAAPNQTKLRDNDLLILQVAMPDYPAHVMIDYFGSDGSVTHLVPTTPDIPDHSIADKTYPARSRLRFGDPAPPGYDGLRVGPPPGTDMIVTIASQAQLMAPRTKQVEDRPAQYVAELQSAIDASRRRGAKLAATAFLVEIGK